MCLYFILLLILRISNIILQVIPWVTTSVLHLPQRTQITMDSLKATVRRGLKEVGGIRRVITRTQTGCTWTGLATDEAKASSGDTGGWEGNTLTSLLNYKYDVVSTCEHDFWHRKATHSYKIQVIVDLLGYRRKAILRCQHLQIMYVVISTYLCRHAVLFYVVRSTWQLN
jgi:hypothetical protein